MKVISSERVRNHDLQMEDFIGYLSRVVLAKSDEELTKASEEADRAKKKLHETKTQLKDLKNNMQKTLTDYQKLRLKYSVLQKIQTLRTQGIIVGHNADRVKKILLDIDKKTVGQLRSLEDKLSGYAPEAPKISFG